MSAVVSYLSPILFNPSTIGAPLMTFPVQPPVQSQVPHQVPAVLKFPPNALVFPTALVFLRVEIPHPELPYGALSRPWEVALHISASDSEADANPMARTIGRLQTRYCGDGEGEPRWFLTAGDLLALMCEEVALPSPGAPICTSVLCLAALFKAVAPGQGGSQEVIEAAVAENTAAFVAAGRSYSVDGLVTL